MTKRITTEDITFYLSQASYRDQSGIDEIMETRCKSWYHWEVMDPHRMKEIFKFYFA